MTVLVAGVGNVLRSDDGFGVEVVRVLRGRDLPAGVEVVDAGIRGMHLAFQLLDGYSALVLVDAVRRGGRPGGLHVLEHDPAEQPADAGAAWDAHGMEPASLLAQLDGLAAAAGVPRPVERVLVVGCEPATLAEGIGLSPPVAAAVGPAATAVLDLVRAVADRDLRRTPSGGKETSHVPGDPRRGDRADARTPGPRDGERGRRQAGGEHRAPARGR